MSMYGQQQGAKALPQAFKKRLADQFSFVLNDQIKTAATKKQLRPVLLAISGGMDSMVLAHLLINAGIPAIWVHCNFHLRGDESNRDEVFVRDQAAALKIPLIVKDFETERKAAEWKMSIEETARRLRYEFFAALIEKNEAAWAPLSLPDPAPFFLMTAHHANDQIETLLLNFFRGSGISGLHGIPSKNNYILRPLLSFKRALLSDYAAANGLKWVEDSTNQSTDYTRNFLRHKILPELQTVYPGIEDTLMNNIKRFSQSEQLYHIGLEKYKKQLTQWRGGHLHLSVLLLQKSGIASTLLWEVLKPYGFHYRQLPEVEKLLVADSGAYQDNSAKDYRLLRNRAHLILTPISRQEASIIVIEDETSLVEFTEGSLEISNQQTTSFKILTDNTTAQVDRHLVTFPLLLRQWKAGDYFYPLGMRKKKKIARYLIDQKVSMHEKEHVWVLESQGRIIWVVGYRLDDRFKITPQTKNILKLKLHKQTIA